MIRKRRNQIFLMDLKMCSKNIFCTLRFWVGMPQKLGFDFSVQRHYWFVAERVSMGHLSWTRDQGPHPQVACSWETTI